MKPYILVIRENTNDQPMYWMVAKRVTEGNIDDALEFIAGDDYISVYRESTYRTMSWYKIIEGDDIDELMGILCLDVL